MKNLVTEFKKVKCEKMVEKVITVKSFNAEVFPKRVQLKQYKLWQGNSSPLMSQQSFLLTSQKDRLVDIFSEKKDSRQIYVDPHDEG